ncbi:MAG: Gfo/Idh/MocA family oxidoreductase [Spirochaetes bacterium]|jgi:predicted dehydrogenase|nr:Gfo/Idh/MocA family oxidoreductase [Spirochaetota bacterium]
MSETRIRTGIVGSGFAAQFHYEALRQVHSRNLDILGVYSPTEENRKNYAEKRGLRSFDAVEELIEAVDVVHVCTPPATHEPVAVAALEAGRSVIIEKPFTGYFGDHSPEFSGDTFDREEGLRAATESIRRLRQAEAHSSGMILYAENWVYAPAIQKEREMIEKTGAQVIWQHGEESHSGSHSQYYGIWSHSGGGSIMGKGVHPLTAALYMKKVEGRMRGQGPIRAKTVNAQAHAITRSSRYEDRGFLRTTYTDIEDFGHVHVTFEDGTFADVFASELVQGGVHNWLEVNANNHRTICNINPNTAMQTYNPVHSQFDDIYVVEKTGTKQGWSFPSPDEDWFTGYQHEMEAFYGNVAEGTQPESDSLLGADTIAVVYAAYVSAQRTGSAVEVPLL